MGEPLEDIGAVFGELVNQFSDPLAFFRELIQNSIDAGTQQIDIWFEYKPGDSEDEGILISHIDDFGEGMSREIIETKLTRLFSSTKDDDFTKIGRFGIGFVSVFAIQPDAVVLDTAHAGEAWRVIFHPDRTYDLLRLDEPVEGTQIQVIKTMSESDALSMKLRAGTAIGTWCRHVEVPIFVEGEDVREPFKIDSDCMVEHVEPGTRIVMGYVRESASFGFYNRGLTLMEGHDRWWPNIAFKIDSRYLEHTLTRDQVLEDRHFHKAKAMLEELALKTLPKQLFQSLSLAAQRGHVADAMVLYDLVHRVLKSEVVQWSDFDQVPVIPVKGAQTIGLREAVQRIKKGRLFLVQGGDHLVAVHHEVIALPTEPPVIKLIDFVLAADPPMIEARWFQPREVDMTDVPGAADLVIALRTLMERVIGKPDWVGFGDFAYQGSPFHDHVAITTPDVLKAVPIQSVCAADLKSLSTANHVVINAFDRRVVLCMNLAQSEPEFAAMQLLKTMVVERGLLSATNVALAKETMAMRADRLGAA